LIGKCFTSPRTDSSGDVSDGEVTMMILE
jgi:hypothetical protein